MRDTEFYKKLNTYEAVAIAEGFSDTEYTEEETLTAWQYIYDKKLYLHLQGFFGRGCGQLLRQGLIEG